VKRAPIVIEDRELLARPVIISPSAAVERLRQKELDKEQYNAFRKDTEHRREVIKNQF
jgi:hypothetical protein